MPSNHRYHSQHHHHKNQKKKKKMNHPTTPYLEELDASRRDHDLKIVEAEAHGGPPPAPQVRGLAEGAVAAAGHVAQDAVEGPGVPAPATNNAVTEEHGVSHRRPYSATRARAMQKVHKLVTYTTCSWDVSPV